MNLSELQQKVKQWTSHNFPDTPAYRPLLGIVEEVGELAHAHLKMEQGIRNIKHEDKIDAIGDTIIYMADYCNRNGIDLEVAIESAWATASKRDWVKFPGNGRTE